MSTSRRASTTVSALARASQRGRGCASTISGTRASLLIAEGVKPKLVQAILRHSKLSTTMDLYVHAYDEDLRGPWQASIGCLVHDRAH
jgi:site-specific recombinase XerD